LRLAPRWALRSWIVDAVLDPAKLERAAALTGADRREQLSEPFDARGRHPFPGYALCGGPVEIPFPCGNLGGVFP